MSYLGYTSFISNFCYFLSNQPNFNRDITILEIGVDRGQTALPLLHNLTIKNLNFIFVGVDIRYDSGFAEQVRQMDLVRDPSEGHLSPNYFYTIQNSLDFLESFTTENPDAKFDVVLLDGDHNYQTVSKELEYFNQITYPHSLCILDDYSGRHAHVDTYYADNEDHAGLPHKKFDRKFGKKGMQTAVNEFIEANDNWSFHNKNPPFEPVIIRRDLLINETPEGITISLKQ